MNLLVRAPNWIGDVVLSLPALRDLRRNFPEARLEVLARPWVAKLYEAIAEVDGVVESRGVRVDAAALHGRFDAAVLFTNSFGSALSLALAGIPERWGYATEARGALRTRRARVPGAIRGRSQVYYYRAMLAGVGLHVSASPDASLRCPEAWAARGAALLGEGRFVGVNPGAAFGSAKRWIAARYAAAATRLAEERGAQVAILGGGAERALGDAIASAVEAPVRNLCGETDLPALVGVLGRLELLLTNDSGPMHLASALGTPLVAVYGSTDWRETAPAGPAPHRIVREDVDCAPCLLRECPIDHRCMTRVGVDRVVEEARRL
ncbi:MAG TPA: lipopolysaccharide heptosyltransferase II [Vicinamibacteria bacterium]|nr:lipopolysaccharide heptosyltransferase II [Vicinamibacteria bacterium]